MAAAAVVDIKTWTEATFPIKLLIHLLTKLLKHPQAKDLTLMPSVSVHNMLPCFIFPMKLTLL